MDVATLRFVVVVLGIICVCCVGGQVVLQALGFTPSPDLGHIAATVAGAIIGIPINLRNPNPPAS